MYDTLSERWQLEGRGIHGEPWIIPINSSPFQIGRKEDSQLHLSSDSISRCHAEIRLTDRGPSIKDCGSTNGTFVNFRHISGEQLLTSGDIVHFASLEFRITQMNFPDENTLMVNPYVERFHDLISQKAVMVHFQPIVELQQGATVGYELLGRVNFEGVPDNIGQLFEVARTFSRDIELSMLLRDLGIAHAIDANLPAFILFNTVPRELDLDFLRGSLATLRRVAPNLDLAMEIHESTITDIGTMRRLRALLNSMGIKLVYDDFGAGQSRLLELMEVPPDILKFDICLMHDLHLRSESSRGLIRALVETSADLGVRTLAEGIESKDEAEMCRSMGFDLAQGFFFGKPMPTLLTHSSKSMASKV
jgi:EAL domain-containing protein (putative c-di-GMP-specific phosphodiesterase class I)